MSRGWIIFLIILTVLVISFTLLARDIKNNLTGEFLEFNLKNIKGVINPTADIDLKFKIINDTFLSYTVRDLKVKIYNEKTKEYLTENIVKGEVKIPKGDSEHTISLKDNSIIGNVNDFLEGKSTYLAVITFKILGQKILFEQLISL